MDEKYAENKLILQTQLASYIQRKRIKLNKSISLISAEVGMTKSMWSDMEKGIKDPQFSTLWRISEGLNEPITELIQHACKDLPENFSLIE